jgi:hypothetical protein
LALISFSIYLFFFFVFLTSLTTILPCFSNPIAQAKSIKKTSRKVTEQGSSKVGLHPKQVMQVVAEYKQKIEITIKSQAHIPLVSIFPLFLFMPSLFICLSFNPRL